MLLEIELSRCLDTRSAGSESVSAMLSDVAFLIRMNWLVVGQVGMRFLVYASTMVGK